MNTKQRQKKLQRRRDHTAAGIRQAKHSGHKTDSPRFGEQLKIRQQWVSRLARESAERPPLIKKPAGGYSKSLVDKNGTLRGVVPSDEMIVRKAFDDANKIPSQPHSMAGKRRDTWDEAREIEIGHDESSPTDHELSDVIDPATGAAKAPWMNLTNVNPSEDHWNDVVVEAKARKKGVAKIAPRYGLELIDKDGDPKDRLNWKVAG